MNSRERLLTVINGGIPDHVPVAPDTSNMIPAKMTGLPFWDLYLYQKIPIWLAYINCVKHFGFDSLMDGYVPINFDDIYMHPPEPFVTAIIDQTEERIITRTFKEANGKRFWSGYVSVYPRSDPPAHVKASLLGLPEEPGSFTILEGVTEWPKGAELLSYVKKELGDHGLVGITSGTSKLLNTEDDIYDYYEDPDRFVTLRDKMLEFFEKKLHRLMSLPDKPDFICTGGSGTLVHQSPEIFRELGLPIVKRITALCKEYGIPTHIHSCGPETLLVDICANETDLTIIDPLEIPPMGDVDLKELKRLYGHKLVLKGNIHTVDVMLNGTPDDVRNAAKKAIDDAAAGGRFILSTGDQCGRDTPHENLFALIETAQTYGRY